MSHSRKKIVVLSGAGISAESGLGTFRDSGGLWEKYDISKVATIEAWHENPTLVLEFYDARRKQIIDAKPNIAHFSLVELEKQYDVTIVTQNIDDLHERSGSSTVLHLHGEILKSRSEATDAITYPISGDIKYGDLAPDGQQLRPHIVWFGEDVPKLTEAQEIIKKCDILIIVGTSLNVYPAAGLRFACPETAKKHLIDPNAVLLDDKSYTHWRGTASEQIPLLVKEFLSAPVS